MTIDLGSGESGNQSNGIFGTRLILNVLPTEELGETKHLEDIKGLDQR